MDGIARDFFADNLILMELAVALLLGALIGIERGWSAREREPGERVAGVRTHALIGLFGGVAALLSEVLTYWAFPLIFLAIAGIALAGYRASMEKSGDYSITGLIGLLLTFCFGALAVAVDVALATACAVVTALILDNKREIHELLHKLHANELDAALKLLLISVVVLPLLPNEDMGPGGVLNPYEIWWLVVLVASISFIGYFAVRLGGTAKGILFTGLFAGLSSSTALTLQYARQARREPQFAPMLAAGILLACGTMLPRLLLYAALVGPAMLPQLLAPLAAMGLALFLPALWLWRRHRHDLKAERPMSQNPLELRVALLIGALLATVMVLGEWLRAWLGDAGIYLLAATAGIADVHAIALSLGRMATNTITPATAVMGIVLAAAVNNLFKVVLTFSAGNARLTRCLVGPLLASATAGLAVAWLV
ncbi:MgtC/SapB family protein [Halomonas daqingensis]|uniref:MgtC/SapB family protein n=1 Tax=Billgrantia desiderata TaxID=52021 RepID=A0ABS9B6A2_9GAMM|nr:MgtC/SapB family protein [Halomonas desiderata]MCE8028313.1 MgtC/SapB family protein [Halomonas desiderata]MCE8042889.1 MgtC/SapB family protein [Halomonas desiderata]MCE8047595.1 MgtC/SapB family protein [Halomonas desiderata]